MTTLQPMEDAPLIDIEWLINIVQVSFSFPNARSQLLKDIIKPNPHGFYPTGKHDDGYQGCTQHLTFYFLDVQYVNPKKTAQNLIAGIYKALPELGELHDDETYPGLLTRAAVLVGMISYAYGYHCPDVKTIQNLVEALHLLSAQISQHSQMHGWPPKLFSHRPSTSPRLHVPRAHQPTPWDGQEFDSISSDENDTLPDIQERPTLSSNKEDWTSRASIAAAAMM